MPSVSPRLCSIPVHRWSRDAARLLLNAQHALTIALGRRLGDWRLSEDRTIKEFAGATSTELELERTLEILEIVRGRMKRLSAGGRRQYTPDERLRIVGIHQSWNMTYREAAHQFAVTEETLRRWRRDLESDDESSALLRPRSSMTSLDDATTRLIYLLDGLGVGGSRKIAQHLLRLGRKISHETVRKTRRRPYRPPPSRDDGERAIVASYPGHIWLADVTRVPAWRKKTAFSLAAIIDAASRLPLAWKVTPHHPTAEEMIDLLDQTLAQHPAPERLLTDRGKEFGAPFQDRAEDHDIDHAYGAINKKGSTSIIERFWRTTKELLARHHTPPLATSDLEQRVAAVFRYYSAYRPHTALDAATPIEAYLGVAPPTPERWRPGPQPVDQPPPEVVTIDRHLRLAAVVRPAA